VALRKRKPIQEEIVALTHVFEHLIPSDHRRLKHCSSTARYAPGSSTVTSHFSVLKSVRVNFSIKCKLVGVRQPVAAHPELFH
jgi:hypothetical protein